MADVQPFSLVRGGPYYALAKAVGLVREDRGDVVRQSIALGLVPWCVLMAAAGAERVFLGRWPELVSVLSVHARLLLAVPAFFLAERSLHLRTGRCLEWLEGFVGEQQAEVGREAARIARLRDAVLPELLLLVITAAVSLVFLTGVSGLSGLHEDRTLSLQANGTRLVYGVVALPIFQFFTLRWVWRWALWVTLLRGLARLDLRPIATHPDGQGGLSFLSEPSVGFGYVCFGAASVLAAARATRFHFGAHQVLTMGSEVLLAVAVAAVVALGPLVLFSPHLWRARFEALRSFGNLADSYTREFNLRWIEARDRKGLLGTPDLQSLADLANSYGVLLRSYPVPIPRVALIVVALSVVLPFGLFILTQVPLVEVLNEMGSTVFGSRLFSLSGTR